jgi:predicted ArsR family transcriptional regulator
MAGTLETTAGIEDASTYVASIAARLETEIEQRYKAALGVQHFSRTQLPAILVDLKNRAGGAFFVIEEDDDHIVLGNCTCPLGDAVRNHPSLCMLTSNLFGLLTANALGYAAVDLEETIAAGATGCRVVIHLKRTEQSPDTREYFRDDASAGSD